MLSHAKLQTIISTSRLEEAEVFYGDVLGLRQKAGSDGSVVFDVGGGNLRVSPVPCTERTEHTVAGFSVPDVDSVIDWLAAQGVTFERFDGFDHDEKGALLTPDGSRVAWFRDPDGNLLSVVQFTSGH